MATVYLETMGCQMNALDSELVMGALLSKGYCPIDDLHAAELVIINTCSVRQHAEDKVYSRLGQLRGAQATNPDQIVAVIGCMAERDGEGLLAKAANVDILCGPSDLHRLPSLIDDVRVHRTCPPRRKPAIALSGKLRDRSTPVHHAAEHDDLEALDRGRWLGLSDHVTTPKVFSRHQAYVRITRGCNKFCTFCVVPYTRGPEVHRPPDPIVQEVRRLADSGVIEVTLLGQTVNHYDHRDEATGRRTTFAELLHRVHDEVPQLSRLRFVTSFPRDFTDEALEVMAASPRICRYLHVPAQCGSNAVLKRMNRGYSVAQYLSLLDRARALMPDISIAGDMIVGFPGETEADFQKSLDLLRRARYKNCFIFKYSPRPGTTAHDRLPDDVPDEVKRRRNNDMLAVQAEINLANHRALLDEVVEVLVEGPSKRALMVQESEQDRGNEVDRQSRDREGAVHYQTSGPSHPRHDPSLTVGALIQLVGRTRGDQMVVLDGPPDLIGRLVNVRVYASTPYTLHGQLIDAPLKTPSRPQSKELPLAVLSPCGTG